MSTEALLKNVKKLGDINNGIILMICNTRERQLN